jgi:hypothetical protein
MSYDKKGKFTIYWGIVAEDKVHGSRDIKVFCPEILPYEDNHVPSDSLFIISIYDRRNGKNINDSVKVTNVIEASYFDFMTNRSGPPDIVKDEQVLLFQYADTDEYYWYPAGRDDNLRKTEHWRICVANDQRTVKILDKDNTYYIELDTLYDKAITVATSKSDGEKYKYHFKIDAKNNTATLQDDIGNEIWLESDVPRIMLKNSSDSIVDLNDKDILLAAPRDLVIKAGRQILVNAPNMSQILEEVLYQEAGEGISNITKNFVAEALTIGLNGDVKIPGTLISSISQAMARSIGPVGTPYVPATVELSNGSGNPSNSVPDKGNGGANNRTLLAWEQLSQAIQLLVDTIKGIDGQDRVSVPGIINGVMPLVEQSIMPNSKGDPL